MIYPLCKNEYNPSTLVHGIRDNLELCDIIPMGHAFSASPVLSQSGTRPGSWAVTTGQGQTIRTLLKSERFSLPYIPPKQQPF